MAHDPLGTPSTDDLRHLLAVARGDEPADLLLVGARTLCVFTREWLDGPVAISRGRIIGIGERRDAHETVNLEGTHLVPGFIDAHVHIESSKLTPAGFAQAVVPRGTTAIVAEPHEIGNVLGIEGVSWFMDAAEGIPLDVFGMAPSCVPASPFESSGATIDAVGIEQLLEHSRMIGVGEMMNFPGVIAGDEDQLAKLRAGAGTHIDGHAPGVGGTHLDAYTLCGIGSDHESTTVQEALDKRRRGMWIFLREASNARNLRDLIPLVKQYGPDLCALCTDDREPDELHRVGHIDELIRICIQEGLEPETALVMATWHPARAHGLSWHGAIAPGMLANLVALEDVHSVKVARVWHRGRQVFAEGQLEAFQRPSVPDWVTTTMHQAPVSASDLALAAPNQGTNEVRVIGIEPDQLITHALIDEVDVTDQYLNVDPSRDRAKLAVIERHTNSGRIGLGFVRGFTLQSGAIASTVAHDAHNTVIAGVSDDDMALAANRLAEMGGGIVVADGGRILAELALPIAGLVSDEPPEVVASAMDAMHEAAHSIGVGGDAPFMVLSFLALSVIPHLKLTDRGYVDVDSFQIVPTTVGNGAPAAKV